MENCYSASQGCTRAGSDPVGDLGSALVKRDPAATRRTSWFGGHAGLGGVGMAGDHGVRGSSRVFGGVFLGLLRSGGAREQDSDADVNEG